MSTVTHYLAALAAFTLGLIAGLAIGLRERRALTRELRRERAMARLQQTAWAHDVHALQARRPDPTTKAAREQALLAEAATVIDAALAATGSDLPRGGGTDG